MCWRDIYILNTQDVLVNVRLSGEFSEDKIPTWRQSYSERRDGHWERPLSIASQTNQTWGQQRHMTNTDLFASKQTRHMHAYTYKPTSFPYRHSSIHPSFQPAMQPAENKFSFPLRWVEVWRYAPLLLVSVSSGPSTPWSKNRVSPGKLTDRGYN